MFLRLTPGRDERAALALEDLASALDAGLSPSQLGGDPSLGDGMLVQLVASRGVALDPPDRAILMAAWQTGRGPAALRRIAVQRQQRAALARSLLQSFRYPAVLIVLSATVATICGRLIQSRWLAYGPATLTLTAAVGAFVLMRRSAGANERWLRLPLVGDLLRDLAELPYLEVLHGLYASGVPLLSAHPTAVAACPLASVRQQLLLADQVLQAGRPLHEALAAGRTVHHETVQLVGNGERAGNLEQALQSALTRRREVAGRRARGLSRTLAIAAQAIGFLIAIATIFSFYSAYFGLLGRGR